MENNKPNTDKADEWINVKDGFPKKEGDYLVICKPYNETGNYRDIRIEHYFKVIKFQPDSADVTHWMPLPKPPIQKL